MKQRINLLSFIGVSFSPQIFLIYSSLKKTYVSANGELLAHRSGNYNTSRFFYLHDRLGSVRQIINTAGSVSAYYTYSPSGEAVENSTGPFTALNRFRFAGDIDGD